MAAVIVVVVLRSFGVGFWCLVDDLLSVIWFLVSNVF
jgi:hypothetical protein